MKILRKLGIFSLEDFVYACATTVLSAYVISILLMTVLQVFGVGKGLVLSNRFAFFSLDIQFPFFLLLCVVLMYLSMFIWVLMGVASIFYNKKEDKIEEDDSVLISVMIPAHNEEKVIRNILNDLICQEYKNLEILVLAHNCTDNTIRNAKSVSDERIKVLDIQTRKSGKALALNEGLKAAKGKIIAQFDTDNRIKDKKLFNRAMAYFKNEEIDAIQAELSTSNMYSSILTFLQEVEYDTFSSISWRGRDVFKLPCFLAGTGIFIRTRVLQEAEGWTNSLVEDFELFTRLTLENKKIIFADNLVVYDEKPPSWSGVMKQRSRWIKGHLRVTWDNLHRFGNWLDYAYRLSPLSVFAWWASNFLYWFYYLTNQVSIFNITGWIWLIWTSTFFGFLFYNSIKKRGWKRALFLPVYWIFGFHWLWCSLYSLGVKSWQETKTVHYGDQNISRPRTVYDINLLRQLEQGGDQ
ncbi:MAG: glycosyltransferase family 2 protein [Candidatus Pacebacteria bacterium]|nr:glycosyltransferase family 2 protein [Candidatus Paceibacterota bacterium]MDD5721652.1 glycosyltransferase family 2 protein [Candidatus Paceibacterota bacterium]